MEHLEYKDREPELDLIFYGKPVQGMEGRCAVPVVACIAEEMRCSVLY